MSHITLAQKPVLEHGAESRRDRHCEPECHSVVYQSLHHKQQRNVRLGYRLKEPVIIEEMIVLGVSAEGKVRVQNKSEIARPVIMSSVSFRPERGTSRKVVRSDKQRT